MIKWWWWYLNCISHLCNYKIVRIPESKWQLCFILFFFWLSPSSLQFFNIWNEWNFCRDSLVRDRFMLVFHELYVFKWMGSFKTDEVHSKETDLNVIWLVNLDHLILHRLTYEMHFWCKWIYNSAQIFWIRMLAVLNYYYY